MENTKIITKEYMGHGSEKAKSVIRIAVIMGKMHAGGKKNLVMEYYRHIDRSKIQFDFICDEDSNAIPEDEILELGGRVFIIPPYQHILSNLLSIKRILKKNRYQIIHGYNSTMNVFPMAIGKLCGVPIRINESISMGNKGDKKNILKNCLKPFSKLCSTHYMANGDACGRWQFGNKTFDAGYVKVFKTVIDVDKNRFNPELRAQCRNEYGLDDNIVLGHIGRFTAQKNTLFMIDIVNEICKLEKKAKLLLIGHGELENEMLEKIKKYDIEDRVLYLGKREDIQQFYNAMDCFLLPSLYEGLPVVGVEAECCGLPVFFSTEIPRESSPCDDLGFFLDLRRKPEDWAKMILGVTKKKMTSRGDKSIVVKEKGFDSLLEGKKLAEYYCSVLEEKNED